MTPKEKAIQLIDKFKPHAHFWVHDLGRQKDYDIEQLENAKECALILVNEILNNDGFTQFDEHLTDYWQQVKQELQKI
jgi:galactokinase/mevalonate kinase-like predicted kinase